MSKEKYTVEINVSKRKERSSQQREGAGVYSIWVRDLSEIEKWKNFAEALEIKFCDLLENSIREYMENHALSDEQKREYNNKLLDKMYR